MEDLEFFIDLLHDYGFETFDKNKIFDEYRKRNVRQKRAALTRNIRFCGGVIMVNSYGFYKSTRTIKTYCQRKSNLTNFEINIDVIKNEQAIKPLMQLLKCYVEMVESNFVGE